MKFEKRSIALLLVFVLLLTGCANGQLSATDDTTAGITVGTTEYIPPTDEITKPGNSADETIESTGPETDVTCQYLPKAVESSDDLPVLKWVCLTDKNERIWNETAAVELNQMLSDRNMPFQVQFALLTTDQRLNNTQEWFAFPEVQEALKEADLIYAGMNETSLVEYLMPITEHVTGTAEPSLKNAVAHEVNWLAATVEGEIYGMDTFPSLAYSDGWRVDSGLLRAAGLTAEDFQRNYWEMDEIFAKLYAANGNQPFLYLLDGYWERTGSDHRDIVMPINMAPLYDHGVLPEYYDAVCSFFSVDYSVEMPVVVNYLETEVSCKLTEAAFRYKDAKYTTEDSNLARVSYTNLYTYTIYNDGDTGEICIPVTDTYYTAPQSEGYISGVAAVSQHKEEALALMNLIAEDKSFRMQLFYGKEGRDYQVVDGYYKLLIQEDGSNYSLDFLSPLSYFCGLTENIESANPWVEGPNNWRLIAQEGKTTLQTYQNILDQSVTCYPDFFDYSEFTKELAAMERLFKKKYASSFVKENMTEAQRQQLVEDLKAAGSDKVLAELQRQLTEWQKNNPDWKLKPEE